ncbi:MAG: hypothetical protein G01um101470_737 [Parcubacteria group bacterium Gr01-1014_70]|nr:MAG: hypothetical protein G01um101470_737 [Parcubacteria group bacterium Gr01-1014_70]
MTQIVAALLMIFLASCSSQRATQLGSTLTLPNGDKVAYYGVEDKSRQGLTLKSTDRAVCDESGCRMETINLAATDGIADKILQGLAPAAAQAAGFVWGMSALRPPKYNNDEVLNVNQDQKGGAQITEQSTVGGGATVEEGAVQANQSQTASPSSSSHATGGRASSTSNPTVSPTITASPTITSTSSVGDIKLSNEQNQRQDQQQDQTANGGSGYGGNVGPIDVSAKGGNVGPIKISNTARGGDGGSANATGGSIKDISLDNGNSINVRNDNRDANYNKNYNDVDVRSNNQNQVNNPRPPYPRPPHRGPKCGMPPCR